MHIEFNETTKCNQKQKRKYPSPLTLRLTLDEWDRLRVLAAGMSVSAYVRDCVFGDGAAPRKRRSYAPVADQEALGRVLHLLGQTHIANNLNQIAYHANCGNLDLDDETEADIKETCAHIAYMRVKLIEALGLKDS